MKPVYEIRESHLKDPRNAQDNIVTLLYDEPLASDKTGRDGSQYTSYTYTVKPQDSNEEHVMFGYSGMFNAIENCGARGGDTVNIMKWLDDKGKVSSWSAEIVAGPSLELESQAAPKRTKPNRMVVGGNKGTHVPSGSSYPGPYDVEDVVQLGLQFFLPAHEQIFGILGSNPLYEDLSQDQLASLATATLINGIHSFRAGQRPVWDEPVVDELTEAQDEFVRRVKGVIELGIARAVLSVLSDMYDMEAAEIADLFRSVQLSSDDLDENVAATWLPFHAIVEKKDVERKAEELF